MNFNNMIIETTTTSSDLQLRPASPDTHEIFRRTLDPSDIPITTPRQQNPRKKRTKMIRFHNTKAVVVGGGGPSGGDLGVIKKKKPDPNAPKITRPCTECGKQFWSWKALFGHMRCHPERPWRGINPPSNLHHPRLDHNNFTLTTLQTTTTEEDEYAVACLLMLANSPALTETIHPIATTAAAITAATAATSHQSQHKCSICSKIFSSGQALGGHKRCHFEKEDGVVPTASTSVLSLPFRFDLNSTLQDDSTCSSADLDLRLGL